MDNVREKVFVEGIGQQAEAYLQDKGVPVTVESVVCYLVQHGYIRNSTITAASIQFKYLPALRRSHCSRGPAISEVALDLGLDESHVRRCVKGDYLKIFKRRRDINLI